MRPEHALAVTRLVSPQVRRGPQRRGELFDEQGVEKTVAIMFLDVRGFTRMSDRQLPYDVVFLLNRFFGAIGEAIASEGGWIDKYMGDGLLAVFGRDTGPEAGCRAALAAAAKIDVALETLNAELEAEAHPALRIGIGLHVGQLVIGRIGHPDTASVTVIGRAVNVASRLEALSKEKSCQLVVSRDLARMADWSGSGIPTEHVTVRGASEAIEVLLVARAAFLLQSVQERA
jgi:adenylate cyclase